MRRRILLLVVGMTLLVVLAFAIPLAVLIRHNVYNDAISTLQRDTGNVAFFLRRYDSTPTQAQIESELATVDDGRSASVQLPGRSVIGTLPPGGIAALPAVPTYGRTPGGPIASTDPVDGDGYPGDAPRPDNGPRETQAIAYRGGQLTQFQVPALGQGGQTYTVRIWQSDDSLHSGENGPWLLLGGVSVGLLLLGVVLGELLTRRIVRPLVTTADTAARLAAGDVTARAPTTGPPEVADVGLALNRLADRIDELIAEERETVADLSHRLRTPLTALRLDAEALRDPVESERVSGHVSALERMLTAVIRAARRPQREGRMPACDASAVVGERLAFWSVLTEDQQRAATVELPGSSLIVRAGAEDLATAVDALVENVIAHTPEGTAFFVGLIATEDGAELTVADDGPGLPADAVVRGRSDRGSSGLGLDIARRCAEASGGSMRLGASPAGGAQVTLHLRTP